MPRVACPFGHRFEVAESKGPKKIPSKLWIHAKTEEERETKWRKYVKAVRDWESDRKRLDVGTQARLRVLREGRDYAGVHSGVPFLDYVEEYFAVCPKCGVVFRPAAKKYSGKGIASSL